MACRKYVRLGLNRSSEYLKEHFSVLWANQLTCFSQLYDSIEITSDLISDETGSNSARTEPLFKEMISLFEVRKLLRRQITTLTTKQAASILSL